MKPAEFVASLCICTCLTLLVIASERVHMPLERFQVHNAACLSHVLCAKVPPRLLTHQAVAQLFALMAPLLLQVSGLQHMLACLSGTGAHGEVERNTVVKRN